MYYTAGQYSATVKKDPENFDEYKVQFYIGGVAEGTGYFTPDLDDAQDTAKTECDRLHALDTAKQDTPAGRVIEMEPPSWASVLQWMSAVIDTHAKVSWQRKNENGVIPAESVMAVLKDMASAADEAVRMAKEINSQTEEA